MEWTGHLATLSIVQEYEFYGKKDLTYWLGFQRSTFGEMQGCIGIRSMKIGSYGERGYRDGQGSGHGY